MLKSVETHVRVMMNSQGGMECTPSSVAMEGQKYSVSRVHSQTLSNRDFYLEAIRPVVTNALAGQSYTVLFAGPGNSGRSHTLYGSAKHEGMLHFVAKELLEIPEAICSVSGFKVNGSDICDLVTGEHNVTLKELPPPIGKIALAKSRHLASLKDAAAFVPTRRANSDSCFVQFRIYRKLDNSTQRSAFATLSLVDLAAFAPPTQLPKDVQAFNKVIAQIKDGTGSDQSFSSCQLATFMSSALLGSSTVLCVGTLTDQSEIKPATLACLDFMQSLGRVQQVMALIQMVPPQGFADSLRAWGDLKSKMEEAIEEASELGCFQVYTTAKKIMAEKTALDQRSVFIASDPVVVNTRNQIQLDSDELNAGEMTEARKMEAQTNDMLQQGDAAQRNGDRLDDLARQAERQVGSMQKEDQMLDREIDDIQLTSQMDLDQLETKVGKGKQQRDRFCTERRKRQANREEWEQTATVHLEQIEFEGARLQFENAMARLGKKRSHYEAALSASANKAAESNNQQRLTIQRDSQNAIISNLASQVNALAQKAHPGQRHIPKASSGPNHPGRYTSRDGAVSPSPAGSTTRFATGIIISPSPLKQQSSRSQQNNRQQLSGSSRPALGNRSAAQSNLKSEVMGASPGKRSYASNATNNALVLRSAAQSMENY